jgi:cytochrome c peroxidase
MTQAQLRRDHQPHPGPRDRNRGPWAAVAGIALIATSACGTDDVPAPTTGEQLFTQAFPGTNGRSCATCHVPEDNFTLTPAHVAKLLETDPSDPLFSAIDADDPDAETLTFDHLAKGLVRIWLTLPDNVDVIDEAGNVTTPPDRKIFVWRSVPSIADTALTAPFQLDGRVATLEEQAQAAVIGHSEGGTVAQKDLALIAGFERTRFSSDRSRKVAEELADGVEFGEVSDVDASLELSPEEERGREVYDAVCAACHAGANKATIEDRDIHDLAFPALKPDGTVVYAVPATDPPTPVLSAQPNNEFVNIGSAYEAFLSQLDPDSKSFTKDVTFPGYRYRFYTDGSRTEIAADLPPIPASDDPFTNAVDEDGNPVTGPNFAVQFFSTDPGRSMITGSPNDFEAFDVPTLRGVARTAPYFHNNAAESLEVVVDLYSDHFFSRFPSLTLPGVKEPDPDGDAGPPEALTVDQKSDLVAFLKRL